MSGFVRYLLGRLGAAIITLFGVIVILVALTRALPGDPARVIAGLKASPEEVQHIRHAMGLDESVIVQIWRYIVRLLHGDLGTSVRTGDSVAHEIAVKFPFTLELAVFGTLLGIIFGIALGVFAATNKGKVGDFLGSVIGVAGISVPVYWLGILLIVLFAVKWQLLPAGGADSLPSLILPTLTIGILATAVISRMTRSTMIETLDQDYVRTVRGKGVRDLVATRHALRNAFIPILTVIGLQFGTLLGGTVLTETVFSWPGMGRLLVDSIQARDFPVVQGVVLVFAVMFIVVNIVVDLLYSVIDPRVRVYR